MSEQQFREHLAQTQLSPATQDMMVYEPPVGHAAFKPLSGHIQQAKHKEFILAMDAFLFTGGKRGIVEWSDYYTFCEMAHEFTIVGQRARLEKDARYRQFLPYTIITQIIDGKVHIALYQRTKKVGEERLGGKFSVGWGGHIDVTDIVTGNASDESLGSTSGRTASPVINLYQTIQQSSDREIDEEVLVRDADGNLILEALPTMASRLLILDTDEVGTVHVGLIRHAFLPAGHAIEAKEDELLYIGMKTAEDILANYDIEGWTKLYLEYFVASGELNRVA